MVLPHAPIISVGTSQAGSKENGEVAVHSLITDIRGEGDVHSIEVRMSSRSKENGRSVHVEQEAIGAGESEGVRSMYSERACQNQHRHMDVRLRVSSEEQLVFCT